jgi:hypothetical protein
MPLPTYSHGFSQGGVQIPNGRVAASGTTTGAGLPVQIFQASGSDPAMQFFYTGTTCTVLLEGNGGPLDTFGNPPAGDWQDYSAGGYTLTNGQFLSKFIPRSIPYWRTRITVNTAATGVGFYSYVPSLVAPGGVIISAAYPNVTTGFQSYK